MMPIFIVAAAAVVIYVCNPKRRGENFLMCNHKLVCIQSALFLCDLKGMRCYLVIPYNSFYTHTHTRAAQALAPSWYIPGFLVDCCSQSIWYEMIAVTI